MTASLPHLACRREVAEEVGLDVVPGRLLVVTFIPAWGGQRRPILYFMFDCGVAEPTDIALQRTELAAYEFRHPPSGDPTVNRHVLACVSAGLAARVSGTMAYLPGHSAAKTW
jgi:8-oxo-dGTP diphosphatase